MKKRFTLRTILNLFIVCLFVCFIDSKIDNWTFTQGTSLSQQQQQQQQQQQTKFQSQSTEMTQSSEQNKQKVCSHSNSKFLFNVKLIQMILISFSLLSRTHQWLILHKMNIFPQKVFMIKMKVMVLNHFYNFNWNFLERNYNNLLMSSCHRYNLFSIAFCILLEQTQSDCECWAISFFLIKIWENIKELWHRKILEPTITHRSIIY
jgi:hypothetical protein